MIGLAVGLPATVGVGAVVALVRSFFDSTNAALAERVEAYRTDNGLGADALVPVDAVTTSGSGLDPHISVRNAKLQAQRVADERGVGLDQVLALVDEHTNDRPLGILGDPGVNVLQLNLALDETAGA